MNENFAIQFFEGKQVRIVWDPVKEKYFFSVADIVEILTESKDVKQYVKRMRARDPELNSKWGTICTPVEMIAPDGKPHMTNASDLEGIFRIIQSITSKKAEPVKKWLAKVGAQRVDQMIDPELTFQMATTEIARERKTKGMKESRQAAKAGGQIAKNTRDDLERQLGHTVISSERASDYIRPIEQHNADELPFEDEEK